MTARICCGRSWAPRSYVSHTSHHNRVWPTLEEKFIERIDRSGDCWVWTGGLNSNGYGTLKMPGGRPIYAHRYAWEREHGPIPVGMGVLHKCDNPPCVRLDHLFLGSQKVNGEDMAAKDRSTYGERNAQSKLSEAEVAAILSSAETGALLAERFGVCPSTISKIRLGRRWTRSGCASRVHRQTKAERIAAVARVESVARG